MKKKISSVLVFIFFISIVYSKNIYTKNGTITNGNSNSVNKPNYKVEINCNNEGSAIFREYIFDDGICLVKNNEKISINYTRAEVSGGGMGGGSSTSTVLHLTKSGNDIDYTNPLEIKTNEIYYLTLYSHFSSSSSSSNDTKLLSILIIGVESNNISSIDKITNFKGYLCEYKNNNYDYSLTVYCENATQKFSNWPIWYVKKGELITIKYKPYKNSGSSSGFNPATGESGGGGFYENSILTINDKVISDKTKTINVEENSEIILRFKHDDSGGGHIDQEDVKVIIEVDDTPPTMPSSITGLSEGWIKGNVEVYATGSTDDKSGVSGYEYCLWNSSIPSQYWTWKKCPYKSDVAEGSYLENLICFRAVDNVGNVSAANICSLKIDNSKPVITADKEANNWTKDNITINATDTGSGVNSFEIKKDNKTYIPQTEKLLKETGTYTVTARDKVGNISSEVIYKIDKELPVINLNGYAAETWTKESVKINITDNHSGIKSVTKNQEALSNYTEFKIESTGQYEITAKDKVDNENKVTVKIDKVLPSVSELTISGFGYESKGEAEYVNASDVKYNVTENDSGIKKNKNILYLNGSIVNESTDKNVIYREKQNLAKVQRKENDKTFEYSVKVTDNAGNGSVEKKASLTIPRTIILKTVEKEDENQGLRKSCIKDGYTINGILINKINFDLYKEIRLKRTFLADKPEGQNRKEFSYEEYKARFDGSVREEEIKRNWEECAQTVITEADVRKVTIGGEEYWYYEDKIKTESGLGHRGIRYQAEWDWKALGVTERGEYVTIDKTANTPGRVKIRIQGTDENGQETRYVVLDGEGKRIEEESDADFTVPVSGVIRLAVKIEDEDFDDYSIEATELVKAVFMKGSEQSEETLTVAMEGAGAEGYIVKTNENGKLKSQFRPVNTGAGSWHEFANPEVKLYYNKPFNMKITMTEGCNGDSGAYKDVTESGVIMLMADTPNLGGFKLLVGKAAGYNKDGITSRPHQEIGLGIEFSEEGENPDKIEWNYGDGGQSEGDSVKHKYDQSPERKGNTSEYELTIRVVSGQDEKRASVNVHIIDTQYGTLLGDEEWIGMHPVLGRIQVPENVTLSVSDNRNDKENPTVILGYGSALEERKGLIEILKGGKLCVNAQGVRITEGKNGTTFTEVKTEKDGGDDGSLKWGGIVIRSGAEESSIANAEIRYAVNGIRIEKGSVLKARNIQINNCKEHGLKNGGEVTAENCEIEGADLGVYVEKDAVLEVRENLNIWNVENGIECDGSLKAGSIEIKEISEKGISIKGKLETQNYIKVEGCGNCGIENEEGASLTAGEDISVKGFEKGIINKGSIRSIKELSVEASSDYGIRNEGSVKTEGLSVKSVKGRGYICGSGSSTEAGQTKIEAEEIGIHCTGNAESDFGNSEVRAVTYGIKTDRDEKGSPKIKLNKGSIIDGALVLWYDWEGGVLTDEEIQEKIGKNN
ncbi:hypothetical protein SAMN04487977_11516 [Treponema bryantii]|uniref:PKD domain-containing protein n=1 Tax=Treponema bryantii TaxID=163 RepID=A0A1H9JT99_9SPIR|nr:hypothetical protein [Treponema bryantii]SEQ90038.1 hypothetical protein SAMN04487977_11516 [Treponema bryantii]